MSALLLDGLGIAGKHELSGAIVPFIVATNLLFQKFLLQAMATTLGARFEVRSERARVFERLSTTKERVVIPDVVVRERNTRRIIAIVDAKYESSFPLLPASDYYQAYVYGDVLGRLSEPRPLPVVLASPFKETAAIDCQRTAESIDARPHRPITWLLGLEIQDLLSSMGGKRPAANAKLRAALVTAGISL